MTNLITPPANAPRSGTEQELQQIWHWLQESGLAEQYSLEQEAWHTGYWICVFDDYCTGSPGYCGKLAYMIWDGMPDACTVFVWKDGRIHEYASHADCGNSLSNDLAIAARLKNESITQLLKLARTFKSACSERIGVLEVERKAAFADTEDINDQIDHWETLRRRCTETIEQNSPPLPME
ncbi:hypothetical protein GC163_08465 [bacterium]|nr:hypothetical protein [bacterium]